ncbi:adenosylcobinamide amidohydrolase [Acidianus sp. HS-5]|uniref:adenosylcobinamide amidohydrolase n=1 Tax=Acidianus sp. HS-5 TaxID=2886040 RepID=UPI001F16DA58|nr:adenosylcobinamide amidohydrolase [Acidianus sp. HS-5]BDC17890.1 coenzyme F390 synthetase [Acidianus sp. HS-5]
MIKDFKLKRSYLTLSSALYPEGISYINKIKVLFVGKDYCKNAFEDVERIKEEGEIIFITAAKNYVFKETDWGELFISAGIGESGEDAGCTINISAFVDYPLNINGLVDLVRTITEAKSGALRDMNLPFTGTVSDAVAVGSIGGNDYFAGPGSELGKKISREVRERLRILIKN